MPSFQYDSAKSTANREKHGIDFNDAQALWDDPNLLELAAKSEDELRHLLVGVIDGQIWSAVITHRGEEIRIISVRRARKSEVHLYES